MILQMCVLRKKVICAFVELFDFSDVSQQS